MKSRTIIAALCIMVLFAPAVLASDYTDSLKLGKADIQSAGSLAFGPEAILFIGDSMGGSIFAIDTGDRTPGSASRIDIKGINEKVAAMLGTAADQILINDMAVNPISKKMYLAVSRGRGPSAAAVILRVDANGKIEEVSLDNIKHASVALGNAPASGEGRAAQNRLQTITDMAFVDGRVFVAGLSNEEFSSKLRSVEFPFGSANVGTSVEIYHGAHARLETNSPVRTFVPYSINNEPHILAAYTCTPLVTFPVSDLKPGQKILGRTIAELGNRNRPLDMIIYSKGGQDFILMSNSSRGVMKLPAANLDGYEHIDARVADKAGVDYETLEFTGVEQLESARRHACRDPVACREWLAGSRVDRASVVCRAIDRFSYLHGGTGWTRASNCFLWSYCE